MMLAGPVVAQRPAALVHGPPLAAHGPAAVAQQQGMDGRALYEAGCASCHGSDGRGAPRERVAFDTPVPDFTDCAFASREPDADWVAVAHEGGPVRGFDPIMPAFGEAFTEEQLGRIIEHIRTFCNDDRWPRGELNLPRALLTEKAYPEDEAVTTLTVAAEGPGEVVNEVVYEKRFGARSQIELKMPFGAVETVAPGADGRWHAGLGDIAVGVKHALWHSLSSGSIVSLGGEVVLPTGDDDVGLGTGTFVFEPFLSFGQILAGDGFLQVQALAELSADEARAEHEAQLRAVVGRTWTQGRFGRSWSPMLEAVGTHALEGGGTDLDLVPQMQVTVNTRQHVMINLGVRLPVTDPDARNTRVLFYVLWDWFDGGFFDGW
jgi:mono/diheme cytochrome c family protein